MASNAMMKITIDFRGMIKVWVCTIKMGNVNWLQFPGCHLTLCLEVIGPNCHVKV